MSCEAQIDLLANGGAILTTRDRLYDNTKDYSVNRVEEASLTFPSIKELRRHIVREKFHAEMKRTLGSVLLFGGAGLVFATLDKTVGLENLFQYFVSSPKEIPARETLLLAGGGFILWPGAALLKSGERHKYKTDPKIDAFNKTLKEEKPIGFNPIDYLSTIRVPFLHR